MSIIPQSTRRGQLVIIDSEFQEGLGCASMSLWFKGRDCQIINQKYATERVLEVAYELFGEENVFVCAIEDDSTPLQDILAEGCYELMFFYSPKDLEYALGWSVMQEAYRLEEVQKFRDLRGKIVWNKHKFYLHDLSGIASGSLQDLAESVGISSVWKTECTLDKSRMVEEMMERPREYFEYNMRDTTVLAEIRVKMVEQFNEVMASVGIPQEHHFTFDNMPKTMGGIVNRIINNYLMTFIKCPYTRRLYLWCLAKLGRLVEPRQDWSEKRLAAWQMVFDDREAFAACKTREQALSLVGKADPNFDWYEWLPYQESSVSHLSSILNTSGKYNALVLGGRCQREIRDKFRFEKVADSDFKSAYASYLRSTQYPIGLPRLLQFTNNERRWTFGEFRKKIMPNCQKVGYQVFVNGKLPEWFQQDLVHSKNVNPDDIRKAAFTDSDDDDITKIPGEFLLLRREFINGCISPPLWEVLDKVMSDREKKAFDKLEVVTALYYLDSDYLEIDEWIDYVIADRGEYKANDTGIDDKRTRKYTLCDFEGLFGVTTDYRNQLKKEAKAAPEGRVKDELNARQTGYKLFNNTGYGVLATPFYKISNVLCANRITGGLRSYCWMKVKALNGISSITDGCAYQPESVNFLVGAKLPSLTAMVDIKSHRSIKTGKLAGMSFEQFLMSNTDLLTKDHLTTFWGRYGITFALDIDHKQENASLVWAVHSKADYAGILVKPLNGQSRIYKSRGNKLWDVQSGLTPSPRFTILDNKLDNVDTYPTNLEYHHSTLLSVGMWVQMDKSSGYLEYKHLRPGDRMTQTRTYHENNLWCVDTYEQYETRSKRRTQKSVKGQKVNCLLFEKFASEGIDKVERRMIDDRLR